MSAEDDDPSSVAWLETLPASDDGPVGGDLSPGAEVGGFVVEELCSRGGFGTVYRAHATDGRPVALKVLHTALLGAGSTAARFQREAEAIQRVPHPSIVRILGFGDLSDGRPYLAMEWVHGETLEAALASRGAFSLEMSVRTIEALAQGLSAAHDARVVHRDLKAANVMLVTAPTDIDTTASGEREVTFPGEKEGERVAVKLLDFGIAKLLDEAAKLTGTDSRIGTPGYMAPEQILGQAVGPATDVYAVGVLLFHLVTGRLPFKAKSAIDVLRMHLHDRPPRATDVAPSVPEGVSDVIRRCMAKRPAERYATLHALIEDLRAAVAHPGAGESLEAGDADGIGLYLRARADDDALADAIGTCEAAGLSLAASDDRWLLFAAVLPSDPGATRDFRARIARLALRLVRPENPRGNTDRALDAVLYAAPVAVLVIEGATQLVGGDLLSGEWLDAAAARLAGPGEPPQVLASDAAIEGLDAGLEIGPAAGDPPLRRLLAAKDC